MTRNESELLEQISALKTSTFVHATVIRALLKIVKKAGIPDTEIDAVFQDAEIEFVERLSATKDQDAIDEACYVFRDLTGLPQA